MEFFISDLIVGMKGAMEFADWLDSLLRPDVGIEFSAFTHDDAFWKALAVKVPALHCPMTFHGPYVRIEATSPLDSPACCIFAMRSRKRRGRAIHVRPPDCDSMS